MTAQMILLLHQLGNFLIMILIGFVIMRLKWLTKTDVESVSRLVVKVLLPFFLLTTIPAAGTRADLIASLPLIALTIVALSILMALGVLTARLSKLHDRTARAHIICGAATNIGFMGIPLGAALFGAPGVLAASMFCVANDMLVWTVGRAILTRRIDFNFPTDEEDIGPRAPFTFKGLINTNIIMVLVGAALLALEINPGALPDAGLLSDGIEMFWAVLTGIGNICKFLPMMIIGAMLASFDIKHMRRYLPSLWIVLIKLLLMPIATALLVSWLIPGLSAINFQMLIIGIAIPSFATSAATAATYGADAQYAASCTTITTLASMLTLPLVIYLINLF